MMKRHHWIGLLGAAAALFDLVCGSAFADETVSIGGSRAVLIKPNAPRASVILLPGGDGAINAGDNGDINGLKLNQLVRTRHVYAARGLAVLVADAGTDLKSAVQYMAAIKRPVMVIGTSRGTLRAAEGIARGARPDALVLTSGFLSAESGSGQNVMSILGSPSSLPRTLVIHHSQDSCRATLAAGGVKATHVRHLRTMASTARMARSWGLRRVSIDTWIVPLRRGSGASQGGCPQALSPLEAGGETAGRQASSAAGQLKP